MERVRIIKHETPTATYYVPQVSVQKFWSSGYKWRNLRYMKSSCGSCHFEETILDDYFETSLFKTMETAEYYCKEWLRVEASGQVVKSWTTED